MKFELNDDTLLKVSGVMGLGYGLGAMAAPKEFHDTFMVPSATPLSSPTWRFFGHACSWCAADQLVIARSSDKDAKKDALKLAALGWGSVAVLHAYNMKEGTQPREIGSLNAAAFTVMTALCAWRGWKED